MDVFGGWAIEWEFRELKPGESLTKDDLVPAIRKFSETPVDEWIQLGYTDKCRKE